jgi:hypothetical protein
MPTAPLTLTPQATQGLTDLKSLNPTLASSISGSGLFTPSPNPLSTGGVQTTPNAPATTTNPIDLSALTQSPTVNLPPLPQGSIPDASKVAITVPPITDTPEETALRAEQAQLESGITADTTELGTQAATETNLENTAGIPAMNSQLDEINAQIKQIQSDAYTATNTSEDRLAPTFAISGEQAQIQRQASSRIYALSAAASALQGNISLANQQVQNALTAQFSGLQADIDNKKYLLTINQSNFTAAEQRNAEQQQELLTQQQQQLDQQKTDQANIYQVMLTAAQNGADNQTLNAIQQAESPEAAIAAAGSFLTKTNTTTVDANGHVLLVDDKGNTIADLGTSDAALKVASDAASNPEQLAPYLNTTSSGVQYVDLSAVSAADRDKLAQLAAQNGVAVITNKNEAADLTNITNAYADLTTMQTTLSGLTSTNPLGRVLANAGLNQAATFFQTDAEKTAASTLNDAGLDLFKAISGVQGFRGNTAVLNQIKENLPTIYDTSAVAAQKISIVQQLIQNRENAIVGSPSGATGAAGTISVQAPDGNTYTFPTQQAADAFKQAAGIQ